MLVRIQPDSIGAILRLVTRQRNKYMSQVDPFAGLGKAKPSAGGNYITPGNFTFVVDLVKIVESSKDSSMSFVAELEVVESDQESVKKGSQRSWVANFKHASTPSNVKHFIADTYGLPFDDVTDDIGRSIANDANPAEGCVLKCEAYHVKTRAGGDFTKCKWTHVKRGKKAEALLKA